MRTESGTLLEVVADDFAHGRARTGYGVERGDETFVALEGLSPREARGLVGKKVRVSGRALGRDRMSADEVAVTGSGEESVAAAGETGSAATYKKVAVILVNFTDDTRQPTTPEGMRNRMFGATGSVDAYYQDATDGALGVSGDVFGWLTVTRSSAATCDYSAWGNAARSAATNAGADLSGYDHVMYLWPQQSPCSWSGLGQLPGSTSWINGTTSLRTTSHELGHNFGEHHASAARCTEGGATVAIPSAQGSCTLAEYGDPFTVMGASSTYLHTGSARAHLGYLSPVTTTVGQAGGWTLSPLDSGSGTRALRIPRGDGSFLALELRRPHGSFDTFDATEPVANGVTLRLDWGTGTKQTQILDTTPETSSFLDAPLVAGASVTDPVSGATVHVTAVSSAGADVAVAYDGGSTPPVDTTAPTAVTGLTASGTSSQNGASVSLGWQPATDDTGVTGYRVTRGSSAPVAVTGTSWTDTSVTPGATYTYSVAAVDAAGNLGPARAVTVTVPPLGDTTAPSAVSRLKASVKQGAATLTWVASTDDVGVLDYEITRFSLVARTASTRWSERPGAGTWTYTVVARDAAGNRFAPASIRVAVR